MKIPKKEGTCLREEIDINLGDLTILAGENNAGKTTLIKSIIEKVGEGKVIYIPAEKIFAKDNLKTGAAADPMLKAIDSLLDITMETPKMETKKINDFFKKVGKTFEGYGVKNIKLKLSEKEIENDYFKKLIKDGVVKKILESNIIDDFFSKQESIEIENASQGTQRLVISAILKELGKKELDSEKILIFEEPEIYLHPKLKKNLYDSLVEISKNEKIKVLITTHDPYFISLSDKNIKKYKVFRNDGGATEIKEIETKDSSILEYYSHAEINYNIFDIPTLDYALSLYFKIEEIEGAMKGKWCNKEITLKDKKIVTIRDFRNQIGHEKLTDPDKKNKDDSSVINIEDVKNEENVRIFILKCLEVLEEE